MTQKRLKLSDAAVKNRKSAVVKVKKHRIVLIGDSHIKRCSEKISKVLDDSYNVTGITKPNANLEAITSPIDMTIRLVKKKLIIKSAVSLFIEMLKNEPWHNIINHTDVNESFNLFINAFF